MPDNNDDEKNTLDTTDDQKQTSNLLTDADAEDSTKDGPHQGRHDIGGYVPTN